MAGEPSESVTSVPIRVGTERYGNRKGYKLAAGAKRNTPATAGGTYTVLRERGYMPSS